MSITASASTSAHGAAQLLGLSPGQIVTVRAATEAPRGVRWRDADADGWQLAAGGA